MEEKDLAKDAFSEFLEYEAKRNPLRIKGQIDRDELMREAKLLVDRMSRDDAEAIKKFWEEKSYGQIAFLLRSYGLEFKGLTYTDELIKQILRRMAEKGGAPEASDEEAGVRA